MSARTARACRSPECSAGDGARAATASISARTRLASSPAAADGGLGEVASGEAPDGRVVGSRVGGLEHPPEIGGDLFVVPSWVPWSLHAGTQFGLFRFSDAPVMERLNFARTFVPSVG